jgi:hypothetical protein
VAWGCRARVFPDKARCKPASVVLNGCLQGEAESAMRAGFERAKIITSLRGRLLPGAWLLFPSIALGQAPARPEPATIRPFPVHVPDQLPVDLRTIYVQRDRDGW